MRRIKYRGIEVPSNHVQLLKCIDSVNELIDDMKDLQSSWDNLSLLGELTRVGTEISVTRQQFKSLSENLSNSLIEQSILDAAQQLRSRAQNSIDILVRNLFERTADIGFLATDSVLCEALNHNTTSGIAKRMESYTQKYSVYRNVVLIKPDGQILCDMLAQCGQDSQANWLVHAVTKSTKPYVERYGPLLDAGDESCHLVYGWKVQSAGSTLGYVALQFDLEQESETLFAKVLGKSTAQSEHDHMQWTVCGIADASMRVLVSSDSHHIPPGMQLKLSHNVDWSIVQIGATAYMACVRPTRGYQGYQGLDWLGFALVPLNQAFNRTLSHALDKLTLDINMSEGLINSEIHQYRDHAERIQLQLNRSVWNGNISQRKHEQALGDSFSKSLLWEISRAGERTKQLFERTLQDLVMRAIECVQTEQEACAMLAMDLMDRNLYERANDCRWWADNPLLLRCLQNPTDESLLQQTKACLQQINSLYTVYTNVLLIDAKGHVMSSSRADFTGQRIQTSWLQDALRLHDQRRYVVSNFEFSPLYDNRPTYIYCAPVLASAGGNSRQALGVIALVFDSEPQFEAILQESMATKKQESMAYFVDEHWNVVSSTSDRFVQDGILEVPLKRPSPFMKEAHWHEMFELDGQLFAAGCCNSSNYREYKSEQDSYQNNLTCVYVVPLGERSTCRQNKPLCFEHLRNTLQRSHGSLEVATFRVQDQWYGIDSESVIESFIGKNLATMPNAMPHVLGSTLHRGNAVTVIDLGCLMDPGSARRHCDMAQKQLILLKGNGDALWVALMVDELGEIPNVPVDEIRPVEHLFSGSPCVAGLIKTPDNVVLLLESDKILTQLKSKEKGLFSEEALI